MPVAPGSDKSGVTWSVNNAIIFSQLLGGGLSAVSADGGVARQLTTINEEAGEAAHMWPESLPDGSTLFTVLRPSGHAGDARLEVLAPDGRTRSIVAEGVTHGRYVAGHLMYGDAEGTLFLQPYDVRSRRVTGPRRAVLAGARVAYWGGGVAFAVSPTGTLVYATGTELQNNVLLEMDGQGKALRRFGEPRSIGVWPSISPDRRTLAVPVRTVRNDDIWLIDVNSGHEERLTFDAAEDESPVWSSDGTQIAFRSAGVGDRSRIFIKVLGSTEPPRLLTELHGHSHLTAWSPDGEWLALDDAPASTLRL